MRWTGLPAGLVLASSFVMAQPNPQHQMAARKYPSDHLTISTPVDWVEIPKNELDQISANVRKAAPNAKPQPYNYGFQASAKSQYPRVLVQVKTSGRWPEKSLEAMPTLPSMKEGIQRQVGSLGPAFAALHLQIGKATYDPARRIVWLTMQFTGDDGQAKRGLSGLHPTSVGSIQVHCYADAADFERYSSLFSDIIASVQIDDEWKYRERSALSRSIGSFADLGSSALTGAVGAIAALIVLRFLRRRKTEEDPAHRRS